jgi:hypothetical protein
MPSQESAGQLAHSSRALIAALPQDRGLPVLADSQDAAG